MQSGNPSTEPTTGFFGERRVTAALCDITVGWQIVPNK